MQQEIRFATFNACNLAPPGMKFYDSLDPYTPEQYAAKIRWTAQLIDRLDADIIGFQEIFSQAALMDVLAASEKYRCAHHAGFEPAPDPYSGQLTPSVALVSRFPLAAPPTAYAELPRGLSVPLPGAADITRFTRPVLHAQVAASPQLTIHVFVVHLKSALPDYRNGEQDADPYQVGIAALRSLIRRSAEALGLRYLLDGCMGDKLDTPAPLVAMGDFNDTAVAASTQLVTEAWREDEAGYDRRMFDSYRIQLRRDPVRDIGYTYLFGDSHETIDHVLVSEQFNPASRHAIGEVLDVAYFNDHVASKLPEASDHGGVLARIRLYGNGNANAGA